MKSAEVTQNHIAALVAALTTDTTVKHRETLLAVAWPLLAGSDDQSTFAEKLIGRTEAMRWESPTLRFDLERHGGTVNGSSRAEVHSWVVDLDKRTATIERVRNRQLYAASPRLDVKTLATRIAVEIGTGATVPYLTKTDTGTKVVISAVEELSEGFKQTVAARRKRFRALLEAEMQQRGYVAVGLYKFASTS